MRSIVKKMWTCGSKSFRSTVNPDNEPPEQQAAPEGRVRVFVGNEDDVSKFEIEANYLNHPLFERLLSASSEEFGYSYEGALRIVCEVELFLYLVHLLDTGNPEVHYMEMSDLMSKFSGRGQTGRKEADECYKAPATFRQLLAER